MFPHRNNHSVRTRESISSVHTRQTVDGNLYENESEQDPSEYNTVEGVSFLLGFAEVTGLLSLILIAIWEGFFQHGFSWTSNPDIIFNWHPLLMASGSIFLCGNGILMYRAFPDGGVKKMKIIHASIHGFSFIFIIIGILAVYNSKTLRADPFSNMYSLHSWIGALSIFSNGIQWFLGFFFYVYPRTNKRSQVNFYPWHLFFGLNAFLWAGIAALIGLQQKATFSIKWYYKFAGEGLLVNFIGLVVLLFLCLVVLLLRNDKMDSKFLLENPGYAWRSKKNEIKPN